MTAPRLNAGGIIAGKYTVRSVLGNGGAVITYHCVNQQGQEVAVKLYDPAVASHASVMKSLEQAYAATNALPQNSAAPIIDAGYDQPTLAPFSVTELLRLPSLHAVQRRLPPEEVVSLLKGLARSLDLAHVRNVVHGAIKPTNVFIGPSCNPTIVTDFAANLPKAAVPTQEGFVLSAPWIAPEQAQSGSVTPAADVFTVGLLVFFALTGRTYWRSCQGQTFDLNGWQQELSSQRTPASQRAAELGVPLSPTLDIVIWKALSNDPNERYQSIGEFANVIEESMRAQVGSAATMALPMVGDAPSPLPANMRNPERPGPAAGMGMMAPANPQGAATLALPLEQFVPPPGAGPMLPNQGGPGAQGAHGGGAQGGLGMPTQAMSLQQLQAHQMAMQAQSQPGVNGQYSAPPGNQLGSTVFANPPPVGSSMTDAGFGYAQQAREGYPPPPAPTGVGPNGGGKSKVLPVALVFTAVVLLGVVGTVIFLRLKSDTSADTDSPIKIDTSAKPAETAQASEPPPPAATQTSEPASSASSAPAAKPVELKVKCKPMACDEVKVDGKAADLTKPIMLDPGSHEVEVSKAGFVGQTEKVELKEGSAPVEKTFQLTAEKATQSPPPPSNTGTGNKTPTNGGKQPCKKGGFIKKC
ncbi:MAG: protein kinase [Polyangiaceae bacterium]|nr:protein kinase [Polyangiaceae bacterium]